MKESDIIQAAAAKVTAPLREVDPERIAAVRAKRQQALDASLAQLRRAFPEKGRRAKAKPQPKRPTGGWSA